MSLILKKTNLWDEGNGVEVVGEGVAQDVGEGMGEDLAQEAEDRSEIVDHEMEIE
jgi:hypothetical protein